MLGVRTHLKIVCGVDGGESCEPSPSDTRGRVRDSVVLSVEKGIFITKRGSQS